MWLQKEQQIDNNQKIKQNLPENAFEAVKPSFGHRNTFDWAFLNTDNVVSDKVLMRPGTK